MATDVFTLREYADMLDELAEEWDGDQPFVLVGDVHGNVNVTADDGHTDYGPVGFAQEVFDSNGVQALGMSADSRFFGTMLVPPEHMCDEAFDAQDICRHCYEPYDDCACPEAEEVEV